MSRGYRCIIFAAFGWLILAAAPPPNNSAQANQSQPAESIDRPLSDIANAQTEITNVSEYQAPCGDKEYNNKSDLCAQWYAARAAGEAARWSMWTFWIGLGSLALSIAGLWALLDSLKLGREANKLAREEFESARKDSDATAIVTAASLKFAEQNANAAFAMSRSNRAWVCHQSTDYSMPILTDKLTRKTGQGMSFQPRYVNFGQTPAIIRRSAMGFKIIGMYEVCDPSTIELKYIVDRLIIAPGRPFLTNEFVISPDERKQLFAHDTRIMIVTRVEYNDIYTPDDPMPHISEHCDIALYKGLRKDGEQMAAIIEFHAHGERNTVT